MTVSFDMRTIFLVGAATAALGAAAFTGLARMHRPAADAMLRYAFAVAAMAIGMVLIALRDALPGWMSYTLMNMLMSAGVLLTADATLQLFGRHQPPWSLAAQGGAIVLLWTWIGSDPAGIGQRIVLTSAIQCAGASVSVWAIRSAPSWRREAYVPALATFFAGYGSVHFLRGLGALLSVPSAGAGIFAPDPAQVAFGLAFALSPIGLAMIVQMLMHARISGELHRRATTDELTGLHLRGHFFDIARQRLREAAPGACVHHLLMIDLDHFKSVNDRFGHPVGDRALRHAARVLRATLGGTGLLGRYGGEEFCALIRSADDGDASRTIDRLRETLEGEPMRAGMATIRMTASIGAVPIRDAESLERLMVHADHCVYRAKTEGRNRVVRSTELMAELVV